MRIAAFDLGTNMAVAHNAWGEPYTSSIILPGKRPQRASVCRLWLAGMPLPKGQLDVVIYERPFARGMDATRSLWGLAGILEAMAHDAGAALLDVSPGEIKNHVTGHGNADKAAMLAAAQLSGYSGSNEHEADAWCLLQFAQDTLTISDVKGPK